MRRTLDTVQRYPLPSIAALGLASGSIVWLVAPLSGVWEAIFLVTLLVGGLPVLARTAWGALHGQFAADVVAALAITGAAVTGEYLAGCVIVLMQTGGEALEGFAVRRA